MFDFSPTGFRLVLDTIKLHGYEFVGLGNIDPIDRPGERLCLLRHDVDVSMDYALAMARLEAQIGVRATYFVMLRSPMYNLFGRHEVSVLRQLSDLGHEVGLHFDAACLPGTEHTLEEWIGFEIETLSYLAATRVSAFSFHQPTPEIIAQRIEVDGLVNTYHPDQLCGFKYLSDSNREWREHDPFELLDSGFGRIHLLFHPVWWMCESAKVEDCWDAVIKLNFEQSQRQLLDTERAYGGPRQITLKRPSFGG